MSSRALNVHNDIVKLAKGAYKPELRSPLFFVSYLSFLLLFVIRLKFIYFNNVLKQEGLYSKVDNVAIITDLLIYSILFNILFLKQILFYYSIKGIVYTSIITNNSPKLLYNTIILKDKEKNRKLLVSTMVYYCTKYNKSLVILFKTVNKVYYNS